MSCARRPSKCFYGFQFSIEMARGTFTPLAKEMLLPNLHKANQAPSFLGLLKLKGSHLYHPPR